MGMAKKIAATKAWPRGGAAATPPANVDEEPMFSEEQRRRLRDLNVLDQQIEYLERELPMCRAMLIQRPPLQDVRDEFDRLTMNLESMALQLTRFTTPSPNLPALNEAKVRMQLASYEARDEQPPEDRHADMQEMDRALRAIRVALTVAKKARANLLTEKQRIHRKASPEPVARLHIALWNGWGDVYFPARDYEAELLDDEPAEIPSYPFMPSTAASSAFMSVMSICYEAFTGDIDIVPERAVRAFVLSRRGN